MNNNRDVLKYFITYLNNVKSPIITEEEITNNYHDLCSLLNKCNTSYYDDGTSLLSDNEYDRLLDLLKTYERMLPSIREEDTPTKKIGISSSLRKGDKEYKHINKMYSLEKVHTSDDILKWVKNIHKKIDDAFTILISEKIDGIAVKLVYEKLEASQKATLTHCVLRGDGILGTDIVNHVKKVYKYGGKISTIPLQIEVNKPDDIWFKDYITEHVVTPDYLEITGELYITNSQLKKINNDIVHNALPNNNAQNKTKERSPYKSTRHAVSGLVNMRKLDEVNCMIHGINSCRDKDGEYFTDLDEGLMWLDATCGFSVLPNNKIKVSKKMIPMQICIFVLAIINNITVRRGNFQTDLDGIVLKILDTTQQKKLGHTRKYPRWAIAYKFAPVTATSVLNDVKWNMSKTGVLTPVAVLEPVCVNNITYTHASLYNLAYMRSLNLKYGDIITFKRAGDVIPTITGVTVPKNDDGTPIKDGRRSIRIPSVCPYCKNTLIHNDKQLHCNNSECKGMLLQKLIYLSSKKVFDLKLLKRQGVELFTTLINKKELKHPEDIFSLTKDVLIKYMKKPIDIEDTKWNNRIDKILAEIEQCKNERLTTKTILLSLCIPGVNDAFIDNFIKLYSVRKLPDIIPYDEKNVMINVTMKTFRYHITDPSIQTTLKTLLYYANSSNE